MDRGELIPDEIITNLVLDRLRMEDCLSRGWILDGFPRTASQAESLLKAGLLKQVAAVLILYVDALELVKRVQGRVLDPETGTIYHLAYNPPPKEVGFYFILISFSALSLSLSPDLPH